MISHEKYSQYLILDFLVDGNWGPWGAVSSCSKTCGNGTMTKTRQCNNPAPANGGLACPGNATMNIQCYLQECPRK